MHIVEASSSAPTDGLLASTSHKHWKSNDVIYGAATKYDHNTRWEINEGWIRGLLM